MNPLIVIIITFLVGLAYLHYRRYSRVQRNLDMLQINTRLPSAAYKGYFRENLPVVLLNHSTADISSLLASPLTVSQQSCKLQNQELDSFHTHRHDLLFFRLLENSDEAIVKLSPPPSTRRWKIGPLQASAPVPGLTGLRSAEPESVVQVLLRPGTLLCIPRFWRMQVETPVKGELVWTNTIFSWCFQRLVALYL